MNSLVGIRDTPLDPNEVERAVGDDHAGAIVTFVGRVRNHNDGMVVTQLEYEAYPTMATKEMQSIVQELERKYPGTRLAVLHRIGTLNVGDAAVVCSASAAHRGEAFEACRALIDAIKATVPIWKREHGPDGPYWVGWEDARCAGHHAAPQDGALTQRTDWAPRHQSDPPTTHQSSGEKVEGASCQPTSRTHGHAHQDVHPEPPYDHDPPHEQVCHKHAHHEHQARGHAHHAHDHAHAHAHDHAYAHTHERSSTTRSLAGWRIVAITVSDTRNFENDGSGALMEQMLTLAGAIIERHLVRDEMRAITELVEAVTATQPEAVVLSGGTGIGPRDVTCEAIRPLLDRELEGFGEAFRRLSFDAIGTRALLSRAVAGVRGKCLVFVVPGSPKAVTLAIEQLIRPLLPHARAMLLGGGH